MLDGGVVSGPLSAATIGSAVATTIKISQVIYELKAVGEQARDLLDSTQHVSDNLQTARTLRRQKSVHLDINEKKWIDNVLNSTDKTLNNVAALIEPARVDMQTKFGSIGFWNRSIFVFRDSPKVQTHLARLSIASGSLDTVMSVLCAREGRPTFLSPTKETGGWTDPARMRRRSITSLKSADSSPPAYAEEAFLARGSRPSNTQRKPNLYGTEIKESVADQYPCDTSAEPLCTASWGNSPIMPSTYTSPEVHGVPYVPSTYPSPEVRGVPYVPPKHTSPEVHGVPYVPATYTSPEVPGVHYSPLSYTSPEVNGVQYVASTYTSPEVHGVKYVPSRNFYQDKGPSIHVQEISVSPDPSCDLHTRMSSLSLPSQPSLRSRHSISSIKSSTSTVFSDSSRMSYMSNASTRTTAKDRGRAWMAHQANR